MVARKQAKRVTWGSLGLKSFSFQSPGDYVRSMRRQVRPQLLTARRLKAAIEEDSHGGSISLAVCERLLYKFR